jgi:hypothetical protein
MVLSDLDVREFLLILIILLLVGNHGPVPKTSKINAVTDTSVITPPTRANQPALLAGVFL